VPEGWIGGTVAETMDSGGYTYVRVETPAGESVWAAGPVTPVQMGEKLAFAATMPMDGFKSTTLDRTFEKIYFTGAFESAVPHEHAEGEAGHGGMQAPAGEAPSMAGHTKPKPAQGEVEAGSIELPEGGMAIASVWRDKASLAGKKVTLRGKVVKFNGGILGKNWLHLQDGSGDAGAGTHDITVTSEGAAKEGEVVTVTGTVVLDKDFGSGYRYALMVEDASIERAQ